MKIVRLLLALAGLLVVSSTAHAQFADSVLSYNSGTGFAAGYTNGSSALGSPASGSGVTPFAPPFSNTQIVSIGAGGEITLQMSSPILNTPANPYGLDFIIFANSFFVENGGSGQSATTSGSLFFHQSTIQIQVSPDDVNWYTLNSSLAPQAGEWFPTYGGGNPLLPVNPSLMNMANFTGLTLSQVESLYNGSAGGTGYSLSWAQDASGNSVDLASVNYIQIDVESGVLDLDAVSAVPEPATWAMAFLGAGLFYFRLKKLKLQPTKMMRVLSLLLFYLLAVSSMRAMTITENFTNNPAQDGWQVYGDTNLFTWDSTNDVMDVTWDSTQPNSYFYLPLCRTLTITDSFTVSFNIQLNDISYGTYPFYPMNLAVGLFNYNEATNSGFSRPDGTTPDLFEFDYFPDNGLGQPNLSAVLADDTINATNESDFYFIYDTLPMQPGVNYQVTMTHASGAANLSTVVYTNGQVYTTMPDVYSAPILGFHLDTLSISSYEEDATYPDNLLAHGTVGNFVVTLPPAPVAGPVVETENFRSNPLQNGWQESGDTNLFTWDSTNDVMDATWNSTNANSYFYLPLGTTLSRDDDFTVAFDLNLSQAEGFNYGFELALGLFNLSEATNADFQRSTGANSPDLVEFDYFPDVGYGPTVWPTFVDTNSTFNYNNTNDYAIYAPAPDDWYHVVMTYSASNQTMVTTMTNFEGTSGITIVDPLMPTFTDFKVNTFSISSYQDDGFGDSIYAQGAVSNIVLTLPPVVRHLNDTYNNRVLQVQFVSYVNWNYTLERSTDLVSWQEISLCVAGTGDTMILSDTNAPAGKAFYRVLASQR